MKKTLILAGLSILLVAAGSQSTGVLASDSSTAASSITDARIPILYDVRIPEHSDILMYRVYNPNSGEHFYTRNQAEQSYLVRLGWRDEGTGWVTNSIGRPVYRLYNPNAGDHHYTMSAGERDYLVKVGWKYEGEGWKSTGEVPVYRLYNPNAKKAGAHHYTTSNQERDNLVKVGWRDEGIGWYAVR